MCLALLCAVALGSCGGGGGSKSPLDDALGYLPANAPLVLTLRTDLESRPYRDLNVAVQRFGVQGGIDSQLEQLSPGQGLSFSRDIKPLLGNELAIGVLPGAADAGPRFIAAVRSTDGGKLRQLLHSVSGLQEKKSVHGAAVYGPPAPRGSAGDYGSDGSGNPWFAVNGDTLVAAESERGLADALDQHGADDHLGEQLFNQRLRGLPAEGILRASGDLVSAMKALGAQDTADVPWMRALRSYGASLSVSGRTLMADAVVNTDSVREQDLPIPSGAASPGLVPRRLSLATRDQSQTMKFGIALAQASVPQATFADIERVIKKRAGAPLATLLDEFGEGLTAKLPNGDLVTRSEVHDEKVVARGLRALSPDEPLIARLATSGGPVGEVLSRARFLIPALPAPASGFFPEGSKVRSVAGSPDLYQLTPPFQERAPFVFGLLDGAFVTAPSLADARQAARLQPAKPDAQQGAIALSLPIRPSDVGVSPDIGGGITLTTLRGGVEAAAQSLRLQVRAAL
ncbi:MAG: hypothetical protein QOJ38_2020 [Solirubrobacterales bacterium]|jgi:hypothetical protein|nr:hypothetical protein [Solirubrobacterales bacterium]